METLALLIGVLLCLAVVNGRTLDDRRDADPLSEIDDEAIKKHGSSDMRHQRRRRWQMNYGYDYPGPIPSFYTDRRDYDRNPQELLPKIVKLLEEISAYIRRPQPPPPPSQPIYVPYPVPYPVPQYISCIPPNAKNPNVTSRFPEMEDTNQNWGFVFNEADNQPKNDGSRPISFDPIKPARPMKRPMPKVEHGSMQSDNSQAPVTQGPKFDDTLSMSRTPIACSAAILACCADKDRQHCFNTFGCGDKYESGKACEPDSVNEALEALRSSYSPMP